MDEVKSPLLELRKERGMKQGQLAILIGCSKGHLSDLEKGYADLRPEIIESLGNLGLDGNEVAQQHREYMEWKKDELKRAFTTSKQS